MSGDLHDKGFWLFGYGSLIWKPPPHYEQRVPGYIEGYVRRFWQASEDHRGIPEAPGRVVTLIDRAHYETLDDFHKAPPNEKVWGAAYYIPPEHDQEMREYLDIREINGYSIQYTKFFPSASRRPQDVTSPDLDTLHCMVYIGLPENPQFLGPQDPQALAAHILQSRGPSGENKDYLYQLQEALLHLSSESHDAHISDLVTRCSKLEKESDNQSTMATRSATNKREGNEKVDSTEEQEEVEHFA